MRVRDISSRARLVLSGGSATARSRMTSAPAPPCPKVMTGPKIGSSATRIMISWAPGRRTIRSMVNALDRGARRVRSVGHDGFGGRLDVRRVLQEEIDVAAVGPALAGARRRSKRNREAHLRRHRHRIVRCAGDLRFCREDAVGGQQRHGVAADQEVAAVHQVVVDDQAGRVRRRRELVRHRRRRLHQHFLVAPEADHVQEGIDGLIGRVVGGNAGVANRWRASATRAPPIQLVRTAPRVSFCAWMTASAALVLDIEEVGACRTITASTCGSAEQRLDGAAVVRRRRVVVEVDRVDPRSAGRHQRVERRHGLLR